MEEHIVKFVKLKVIYGKYNECGCDGNVSLCPKNLRIEYAIPEWKFSSGIHIDLLKWIDL